jgi:hypothetical protein
VATYKVSSFISGLAPLWEVMMSPIEAGVIVTMLSLVVLLGCSIPCYFITAYRARK